MTGDTEVIKITVESLRQRDNLAIQAHAGTLYFRGFFKFVFRINDVDFVSGGTCPFYDSNPHWRRERVSFRAAYGAERVPAYLFLPRNSPAPYQTVVFFPGSDAVILPSSRDLSLQFLEFLLRSGRAVVYPVYQQMYERHTNTLRTQSFLREVSIQRGQDVPTDNGLPGRATGYRSLTHCVVHA